MIQQFILLLGSACAVIWGIFLMNQEGLTTRVEGMISLLGGVVMFCTAMIQGGLDECVFWLKHHARKSDPFDD